MKLTRPFSAVSDIIYILQYSLNDNNKISYKYWLTLSSYFYYSIICVLINVVYVSVCDRVGFCLLWSCFMYYFQSSTTIAVGSTHICIILIVALIKKKQTRFLSLTYFKVMKHFSMKNTQDFNLYQFFVLNTIYY